MTLRIIHSVADMHDDSAPLSTQLLYGEQVSIIAPAKDGFVTVKNHFDGYEGRVPETCVKDVSWTPTHRVVLNGAYVHPEPRVTSKPHFHLPFGAQIEIATDGEHTPTNNYVYATDLGWVYAPALLPVNDTWPDYVDTAHHFLNCPYLYGGRSERGIDCSALVQLSLMMAGVPVARDSKDQKQSIGELVADGLSPDFNAESFDFKRGDFVFFPGHVGIMANTTDLIHANATDMGVAVMPLAQILKRTANLKITAVRRIVP